MTQNINALKEWTGKSRATLLFDSILDEFTNDGLFEKVATRLNVALIAFTENGDVFGGFYTVAVTEQEQRFDDPNLFVFSFESHGRCATPQRFVLKEEAKDGAFLFFYLGDEDMNEDGLLVKLDVDFTLGGLCIGRDNSGTFCEGASDAFDGLESTTLTGRYPTPLVRLIAVQLS